MTLAKAQRRPDERIKSSESGKSSQIFFSSEIAKIAKIAKEEKKRIHVPENPCRPWRL